MIIVEGMDNSGKSTLVGQLEKDFGLIVVSSLGRRIREPAILKRWTRAALGMPNSVIFDRFPLIGEAIYGKLLRNKSLFEDGGSGERLLKRFLGHSDSGMCYGGNLIIYCRPPEFTLFDWGDREQMDGVKDSCMELLEAYDQFMEQNLQSQIFRYDYTIAGQYDRVRELVDDHVNHY